MQKIINRLLKKGNTAIGTQTDQIEGLGLSSIQANDNARHQDEAEPDFNSNSAEDLSPTKLQTTTLSSGYGQRFARAKPNAMNLYGLNNSMLQINDEKLGELHMRLNSLLQIPVKKLKMKAS